MGPVRVGNQAHEHFQHDTYGNLVLGASQAFFDQRLFAPAGVDDFKKLEFAGERSFELYDKPDAGMWELRHARPHSYLLQRSCAGPPATGWRKSRCTCRSATGRSSGASVPTSSENTVMERAWSEKRKAFVESFGGEHLDASVLLMAEVGFIDPKHPRFVSPRSIRWKRF